MKEIDFLPEWYKSGKRLKVGYRAQYVGLGVIFLVLMVWNTLTTYSVSRTTVELLRLASAQIELETRVQQFCVLEKEIAALQEKADILEAIDSQIDVSSVLAELSFLIDAKIALSKLDFKAEKIKDMKKDRKTSARHAARRSDGKGSVWDSVSGDVQFSIMIHGIAPDSRDVAELIIKLENSPYFWRVYPSYSRNKQIRTRSKSTVENRYVTEFEIGCYLANYRYEDTYQAKDLENRRIRK